MDVNRETRKSIVQQAVLLEPGSAKTILEVFDPSLWFVRLTIKTGLLPNHCYTYHFKSRQEAVDFMDEFPPGSSADPLGARNTDGFRKWIELVLDQDRFRAVLCHGRDDGDQLACRIMKESGVRDINNITNSHVLDFLGEERISKIKDKHGENWGYVAEYQYCWLNIPHTAPAYLAAAYHFHTHITHSDFSAGYLIRDLECITEGVEAEAIKAINMRKNAGQKGREASARARTQRIVSLLECMEAVTRRNPDIVRLGEKSVAALGVDAAATKDPQLWSQGAGQIDEYLGEMRRGEAGEDVKARYLQLFERKTA